MKKQKAATPAPAKKNTPRKPVPTIQLSKLFPFSPITCYAIIGIFTALLYLNSLTNEYALDDSIVIKDNMFTQQGIKGIPKIMTSDVFLGFFKTEKNLVAGGRYRPLSVATFAFEHQIWGDSPGASHFINMLLYACTGIAIFIFLTRLFSKNNTLKSLTYLPLLSALLFIAHPLHTEAVTNIKGRDEVMTFLFAILAGNFFLKYYDEKNMFSLLIASVCFFLALLSKENAITWVAVIPLLFYFFREFKWSKAFPVIGLTVVASVIYLVLRQFCTNTSLQHEVTEILNNPFAGATAAQKYSTVIYTFGRYLLLLIFPHPLTHDYYFNQIPLKSFSDVWVLLTIVVYMALIVIAIIQFGKKTLLSFCIIYFAITFSVVSNVVFPVGTTMSERFLYMSSFGFCIYLAYLLLQLAEIIRTKNDDATAKPDLLRNVPAMAIIVVILLGYSAKTVARNPVWKNNYTLFSTDVNTSPNSAKLNNALGGTALEFLDKNIPGPEKKKYADQAKVALAKAISIYPQYNNAWLLLGNAYFKSDSNYSKAAECYIQSLNINPTYPEAITNLRIVLNRMKDDNARVALMKKLSDTYPGNPVAKYFYGNECMRAHLTDSAIHVLKQVLVIKPDYGEALNDIGLMYGQDKNIIDSSILYLEKAVTVSPNLEDATDNLAVAYGIKGRLQDAINLLNAGIQRNPKHAKFYLTLGITYRAMGDNQKAQDYFNRANEIDPEMMKHMNH